MGIGKTPIFSGYREESSFLNQHLTISATVLILMNKTPRGKQRVTVSCKREKGGKTTA
jgi:hypothetical protein